jgi:PPOX class probable F420-dependent enzyme
MRLSDAEMDARVATAPVARLATVASDGTPHVVPVVFVVVGGDLWSPVDGKPKGNAPLARLRHIAERPHASLLVDRYDDDWRALWWIRIDALASVVAGTALEPTMFRDVCDALRRKYPQYAATPLFSGTPTLVRLVPLRRVGWAAAVPRT